LEENCIELQLPRLRLLKLCCSLQSMLPLPQKKFMQQTDEGDNFFVTEQFATKWRAISEWKYLYDHKSRSKSCRHLRMYCFQWGQHSCGRKNPS